LSKSVRPFLFFLRVNQSPTEQESIQLVKNLARVGLEAQVSTSVGRMLDSLGRRGQRVSVVVLQGSAGPLLHALGFIRALHPALPVVLSTNLSDQDHVIALLAAGADLLLPEDAGSNLFAAAVATLMRRLALAGAQKASEDGGRWELLEKSGELVSPGGTRFVLTDLELAVLKGVFGAADGRISRTDLLQLVLPEQTARNPVRAASYLGVLISRLRAKLRNNGIELPLTSVHGWGYRFTETG
jgi:DNA-binding response OmpR family regulator